MDVNVNSFDCKRYKILSKFLSLFIYLNDITSVSFLIIKSTFIFIMPLDKVKSQRNADQIVHKNGIFRFKRTNAGGTTYWKCIEYDRQSCRCRIHTEGTAYNRRVIKEIGQHNHVPNETEVNVKKFKNSQRSGNNISSGTTSNRCHRSSWS